MNENFDLINELNWNDLWHVIKDIIIPHTFTIVFKIIGYGILGLLLSIALVVFLGRKNVYKRIPKYYNWAVKLYIPLIIIGFLYVFGMIGFFKGVNKVVNKERPAIVNGIYDETMQLCFSSKEKKDSFFNGIQSLSIEAETTLENSVNDLKEYVETHNTGYEVLDNGKNGISNLLIDNYGNDLFKLGLYGIIDAANEQVRVTDHLEYKTFSKSADFLMNVNHEEIESAIKKRIDNWVGEQIDNQFSRIVYGFLLLILIIMVVPLIEFFIYVKWIKPKYISKEIFE